MTGVEGVEGIAVGLSTKILPHNFVELLEAQIATLKGQEYEIFPDFLQGGQLDVSAYQQGKGRVRIRAQIEIKDNKTLLIRETPYGTNTETLITSIENAIHKGKLKIASINDYTTEEVEIELKLGHGTQAEDMLPRLFLYTDCETSMVLNPMVIFEQQPREMSVHQILDANTIQLKTTLENELNMKLAKLLRKYRDLVLVQIFIENKIYQVLEDADDLQALKAMLTQTLEPMLDEQFTPIPDASLDKLLNIPIRRITRFDSNKAQAELAQLSEQMSELRKQLGQLTNYAVRYLEQLIKKYGSLYPRRTTLKAFDTVDVTEVAVQDVKVGYDAENQYLGSNIRTEAPILCSSFDKLLLFLENGAYRVIEIPEKLFVSEKLLEVDKQSALPEASVLYHDEQDTLYMKRFVVSKFILNKDYRFIEPMYGQVWRLFIQSNQASHKSINRFSRC